MAADEQESIPRPQTAEPAITTITMVLEVDLDCERCNNKIRKVLRKIRDKMNITTTTFSKRRNVVTISGPFDAEKVRRKLCCEAGRIIKDVKVKGEDEDDVEDEEEEEEKGKPAMVPSVDEVNLRPLRDKLSQRLKARPQPPPCNCNCNCTCTCSKQTTRPPAQGVAVPSVWPAPSSSDSVHGYEAPSPYYGVPVYSMDGWY